MHALDVPSMPDCPTRHDQPRASRPRRRWPSPIREVAFFVIGVTGGTSPPGGRGRAVDALSTRPPACRRAKTVLGSGNRCSRTQQVMARRVDHAGPGGRSPFSFHSARGLLQQLAPAPRLIDRQEITARAPGLILTAALRPDRTPPGEIPGNGIRSERSASGHVGEDYSVDGQAWGRDPPHDARAAGVIGGARTGSAGPLRLPAAARAARVSPPGTGKLTSIKEATVRPQRTRRAMTGRGRQGQILRPGRATRILPLDARTPSNTCRPRYPYQQLIDETLCRAATTPSSSSSTPGLRRCTATSTSRSKYAKAYVAYVPDWLPSKTGGRRRPRSRASPYRWSATPGAGPRAPSPCSYCSTATAASLPSTRSCWASTISDF